MFEGESIPPSWNQGLNLGCSEVDLQWLQFNPPPPESGVAVKLMCSDCSPTLQWLQLNPPPTGIRSCSEVDVQWLQSNPPPPTEIRSCSEIGLQWLQSNFAVTAVKSPPKSGVEVGLKWSWSAVSAVQLCSDCSQTPPPPWNQELKLGWSEVDLQWVQFNFAVTAVKPPPPPLKSGVEVGLKWSWSAVTAVQLCSHCSRTPLYPTELQLSNFNIYILRGIMRRAKNRWDPKYPTEVSHQQPFYTCAMPWGFFASGATTHSPIRVSNCKIDSPDQI